MINTEDKQVPVMLRPRWLAAVLVIAGFLAYLNSFSGQFVFDDQIHIVDGAHIRTVSIPSGTRPLVDLSLALNYQAGRLDEWGYHAFNLVVHLLAGLALFGVVRRALLLPRYEQASRATGIAFAVALLWLLHPLQTQSVTYVIQRAEAMMGLSYLMTLYCVLRGVTASHPRRWFAAAIAACAIGMGCKPIMVTAPVVVLLFDWLIISGSFRDTLRRRWGLHAGIAATWGLLLVTGIVQRIFFAEAGGDVAAGFAYTGATPLEYALSQPGVILHYLRLSVWPSGQCLDYWWPIATGPRAIVLPAALIAGLVAGTVWAIVRRPWLGFLGAWFFLVLGPTSSIVPIRDIAVEHRMYLPLAAVVMLAVLGGAHLIDLLTRRGSVPETATMWIRVTMLVITASVLGFLTFDRNEDYHTSMGMWGDVVARRPLNPRAHSNYALLLIEAGRVEEATWHCEEAIRVDPDFMSSYHRLREALLAQGKGGEAGRAFLSLMTRALSRVDESIPLAPPGTTGESAERTLADLRAAVRRRPGDAETHRALGEFLASQGAADEALASFIEAARLAPDSRDIRTDLASAYMAAGEQERAIEHFFIAVRLDPEDSSTQRRLAFALALHGDIDATVELLGDPRLAVEAHAEAHVVNANRLAGSGQTVEAAAALRRALEINPGHPYAKMRLDSLGSAAP